MFRGSVLEEDTDRSCVDVHCTHISMQTLTTQQGAPGLARCLNTLTVGGGGGSIFTRNREWEEVTEKTTFYLCRMNLNSQSLHFTCALGHV